MKLGDKNNSVKEAQVKLSALGYYIGKDGDFGPGTDKVVRKFQARHGLGVDGNMGPLGLAKLEEEYADNGLQIDTAHHLHDDEYYKAESAKDTIYLHHTAGGADAPSVLGFWEGDKTKAGSALKVATSYVMGGPISANPDSDGKVYEAFESKYWAHHLGTKLGNNTGLNVKSVGIEVCNWGPVTKTRSGKFITYVQTEIRPERVIELDKPFRGFKYYHKYSATQIEQLRKLIVFLMVRHDIKPQAGYVWTPESFELSKRAAKGEPGIWTHTHVRIDKTDLVPQPALMDMLNAIHEKYA